MTILSGLTRAGVTGTQGRHKSDQSRTFIQPPRTLTFTESLEQHVRRNPKLAVNNAKRDTISVKLIAVLNALFPGGCRRPVIVFTGWAPAGSKGQGEHPWDQSK
jgi:hypothetical protein